ncbi:MAG TPA: IPT/TIG domain-containing protein [Bryobacteraceae bacterium]|nr:IPT/TIG domain-containing protein [Bryobacteraceae bacterium]
MSAPRLVLRRLLVACAVLLSLAASAPAYYHFVHYASRTAPFVPIPEKFDLNALLNNTVYYSVSSDGPEKLVSGDSFAAVLSQLRLAGSVWNGVSSSNLRVAWGGLFAAGTTQTTPHIEVLFEEVPPGLLALGGPTVRGDVVQPENGDAFVPITQSVVILNKDLSARPSYSSGFFLTATHELGHALGLQHTFTSSIMSTDATRASTKASPLGADDAAAISLLYPTPGFTAKTGSLSGRVTMAGGSVALASVVAIQPQGQAISTLTHPDGTYRIDGLMPGNYYVYVHALPPSVQSDLGPAEIVLPVDADGVAFAASKSFATEFYPGTKDARQADIIPVKAGEVTSTVDFSVEAHAAPGLYGVSTYTFPGRVAVKPAYLATNHGLPPIAVASGNGLTSSSGPAAGLTVAVLGASTSVAQNSLRTYSAGSGFLQFSFIVTPFSGSGPRHLVFSTPNELYVLPSGLTLVADMPPAVTAVAGASDGNGNATVTVSGSGFTAATRILFDGEQAATLAVASDGSSVTVTAPPAPAGYRANVIALNPDGQTSLFLAQPVAYTYAAGPSGASAFALSTNALAAGTEAMIEITGTNMTFVPGRTVVGFGSSDVVARRVWVVSPTLLRVNAWVAPGAQAADTTVSVSSGFENAEIPAGFHVRANAASTPALGSDLANADSTLPGVYPGSTATLPVSNLPGSASAETVQLTLNGTPVAVTALDANKITFVVPEDFVPGLAVVRLTAGGIPVAPVFVQIETAPPMVQNVAIAGEAVDADHPAAAGSALTLSMLHLGGDAESIAPERIQITIGGVRHVVKTAAAPLAGTKLHTIETVLSASVDPGDKVPVVVSLDGRESPVYYIPVK